MMSRTVVGFVVGVWLLVAVAIIGYPLLSGRIRVGRRPISRDADPQGFWRAYFVSTVLFFATSLAVGVFVSWILP